VDGKIVLDEDSLQVEQQGFEKLDDRPTEVVEEAGTYLTNASFGKSNRSDRWTAEETELFFKVVEHIVYQLVNLLTMLLRVSVFLGQTLNSSPACFQRETESILKRSTKRRRR
jgi:hypothetical protein